MNSYTKLRACYQDISDQAVVNATGTSVTLQTSRSANFAFFLQRYHVQVSTGATGKTWSIEDSNSTPRMASGLLPVDTAPLSYERDFGPLGLQLTAGKNLVLTISAAGAGGVVTYEGYQKQVANTSILQDSNGGAYTATAVR